MMNQNAQTLLRKQDGLSSLSLMESQARNLGRDPAHWGTVTQAKPYPLAKQHCLPASSRVPSATIVRE